MVGTAIRLMAGAGVLVTLVLMISMARPWGDNYAYHSFSGYMGLLGLAVWATLPYLMILFLVRRTSQGRANKVMVMMGAAIISVGGVALYVDAALLHPDPQGGLVFVAVPCYQWVVLGVVAGIQFLSSRKRSP